MHQSNSASSPTVDVFGSLQGHLRLRTSDDRGETSIFIPFPGMVVNQTVGHLSADLAQQLIDTNLELFGRGGRWAFFYDWWQLDSYDTSARRTLTNHTVAHRSSIDSGYFLTRSKLVSMGISVANVATSLTGLALHATTDHVAWKHQVLARLRAHGSAV